MGKSKLGCFCFKRSKKSSSKSEESKQHHEHGKGTGKKALIVYVHPEARSFNGHLKNTTARILTDLGYCVTVSDLYADKFKTLLQRSDYPFFNEPVFSPLAAGGMAYKVDRLADDVRREKQRLEEADLIVFQFPMWWFTCPSMLHAYFERLLMPGWSHYTDKPALKGKKALISVTTGGKEEVYVHGKGGNIKQILHHMIVGTLGYIGMQVLEPVVLYDVLMCSNSERGQKIRHLEEAITNIERRPLI